MLLFLIAFIAGVLTVLAPCVLPLLPVIVGGSVSGGVNRARAYTVALSLGVSVILFTLLPFFRHIGAATSSPGQGTPCIAGGASK